MKEPEAERGTAKLGRNRGTVPAVDTDYTRDNSTLEDQVVLKAKKGPYDSSKIRSENF